MDQREVQNKSEISTGGDWRGTAGPSPGACLGCPLCSDDALYQLRTSALSQWCVFSSAEWPARTDGQGELPSQYAGAKGEGKEGVNMVFIHKTANIVTRHTVSFALPSPKKDLPVRDADGNESGSCETASRSRQNKARGTEQKFPALLIASDDAFISAGQGSQKPSWCAVIRVSG